MRFSHNALSSNRASSVLQLAGEHDGLRTQARTKHLVVVKVFRAQGKKINYQSSASKVIFISATRTFSTTGYAVPGYGG